MHAHARPNDAALRDASHRLTWQALLAWVDRLADQLAELDLRRGDRVARRVSGESTCLLTHGLCLLSIVSSKLYRF